MNMDPKELSLVPNLVIPPKFKMSKFEKYNEIKCLKTHLTTYCHKMTRYAYNEKFLTHVFQDSLTRAATNCTLSWKWDKPTIGETWTRHFRGIISTW